ncbi:MAG: zinc-dependent peptidase [Sphingobacteriaceae bacterium]
MDVHTTTVLIVVFLAGACLAGYVWRNVGNRKVVNPNIPSEPFMREVLERQVSFFGGLKGKQQAVFLSRVGYFLQTTKISAEKGARVSQEQRVLIAASATIPLFHFDTWSYENLDEVLVYPDRFDEKYNTVSESRNVLGMVGNGAMNRKMILSLPALMDGFDQHVDGHTAIHEFVHLIDKADGDVDGIPEYLIPKSLIKPWVEEMHHTILQIRNDRSDIRDYATRNAAEFLAVVSEYFFKKPELLQVDHPALYALLNQIYNGNNREELSKMSMEPRVDGEQG